MKKVALLFSISHKAPNGASRFVHTFINKNEFFAGKQIDFHVYSRDNYQNCDFSPNNAVRKRKHKVKKILFKVINHSALLTILYDYFAEARTARITIKKYLGQHFNDNLVHCQEDQTAYYLLKKKKGIKVIQTFHSDGNDYSIYFNSRPALDSWLGHKYLERRYNYIRKNADRLGFVSKNSMELFSHLHPEVSHKLFYVYNGIPDKPLTHEYPTNDDNVVRFICVASINDNKNQKSLIEAISMMPDNLRIQSELILVGDGDAKESLEAFTMEMKLNNVSFKGNCSNVPELLSDSDVFVLVSKSEGLPVAIIEALREGLPIIGSNVGGIPEEVIDGKNGFVVHPTSQNIAQAMTRIISIGAKSRETMGRYSYSLFKEKFSEEIMFNSYADIYNETLNEY